MKLIFNGMLAGVVVGFVLTLWSFAGVASAMADQPESVGVLFVLSAFGMLAVPAIAYAVGLSFLTEIWRRFGTTPTGSRIRAAATDPTVDRFMAAALLALPVVSILVSATQMLVHLAVTSKFQRPSFQALGLAGSSAVAVLVMLAFSPAFVWLLGFVTSRIPAGDGKATRLVGQGILISCLVAALAGFFYAKGLNVWSTQTLAMGLFLVVSVPIVFVAFVRLNIQRVAIAVGVPIAGTLAALGCFLGAMSWTSSSDAMRQATTKHSALIQLEARVLQRFADRDKDGVAAGFGGADCDDSNPEIYPGARDTPGNGIDESCSGADAELPSGNDHPSRKLVATAIDAGRAAATKAAENLPDAPKNVLVLLIDTLRFDHLSLAGYPRKTSPNLDALAADAVVFEKAYATSPHTPRSMPAIFISKYPSRTKWRGAQYNYPRVEPENTSFFEVLQEQGHRNFGFTSHHYFQEKRGLWQGFEKWDNDGWLDIAPSNDDIAAPRIWAKFEPFLEQMGKEQSAPDAKPFSAVVHLFEPHARWIAHDAFDFGAGADTREKFINAYDSEIAYVDDYIGKITQKLKDTGLWDKTVIVVVSDHGEGFNEHGYYFHGQNLYNEVTHVPLIVRVPGWPGRKVNTPVSILDVGPTVIDMLGYPLPADYDGISLVPAMVGGTLADRPVFAELLPYTSWKEHHTAIFAGNLKYIKVLTSGSEELYDLAADPGEKSNLLKDRPDDAARMRTLLDNFLNQ
ncbi:MAG: sulfatase-like hydrolase/transferase [bacterium]